MNGVARCIVGYSGGVESKPNYNNMKDFTESVLVEFDPDVVSYEQILQEVRSWVRFQVFKNLLWHYFNPWLQWSRMDYPYTMDKRQYRSALFYLDDEQHDKAHMAVQRIEEKASGRQVFIDVERVTKFYRAEEYHQDFLAKRQGDFGK